MQHHGGAAKDSFQAEEENQGEVVRHYLTEPSEGVYNDGQDNKFKNLILYYDCVLVDSKSNTKYVVKEMLGKGEFGQVCRCSTGDVNQQEDVAVKVLKLAPDCQVAHEISICQSLKEMDPRDEHHIYRIVAHFFFKKHLCLVFELLGASLHNLLQKNFKDKGIRGIDIEMVRNLTTQILESLVTLRSAGVIHRDLKPDNILFKLCSAFLKVIDFGSARCEYDKGSSKYIQSRHYRAPEVLLELEYSSAVDVWSLGCIAAELFLGRPLFPALCEYDLFGFMIDILGSQPPDGMILSSTEEVRSRFFKQTVPAPFSGNLGIDAQRPGFQLLSEAEVEKREKKKPAMARRPFGDMNLEEIILFHSIRKEQKMEGGVEEETRFREKFIHFLKGVLHFDPRKRWTAKQALQHPFITGSRLSQWRPPLDISPYASQASSLHTSPIWSTGSTSSYPFTSPSSHSRSSPGSVALISQSRLGVGAASLSANAGNGFKQTLRQTLRPSSQPEPSRNQHHENGNGFLTRDGVQRLYSPQGVRNGSRAGHTVQQPSKSRGRDRSLRAALNSLDDSPSELSEGLPFSPDIRPWYVGSSDELIEDAGEARSSSASSGLDVSEVSVAISRLGHEVLAANGHRLASGAAGHRPEQSILFSGQFRSQSSDEGSRGIVGSGNRTAMRQENALPRSVNGQFKSNGLPKGNHHKKL